MTTEIKSYKKVTVLLSTYNGSRFLRQQLDSLYAQTYPNIRILVRDDRSSDSTQEILDEELSTGRIEILEESENLGPALSFFALMTYATTTETGYVAFCDQDDVWQPNKIARAVEMLSSIPDNRPAMFCSRAELVDENLVHLGYTELPGKIGFGNALVNNIAAGCTMLLNREALCLLGKNLPEKVVIHDWWCYLVVSCFGEVIFDEVATIKYRQHGNNVMGVKSEFGRYVNKYRRFFGGGTGHLWMSTQAETLNKIFKDSVPPAEMRILEHFISAKSSFSKRVMLAASHEIWRQRKLDDLMLRLLILLNRY